MSLPVILRPAAEADVDDVYAQLEGVRAGLGDRFIARLRDTFGRIEVMPEMYGSRDASAWQSRVGP